MVESLVAAYYPVLNRATIIVNTRRVNPGLKGIQVQTGIDTFIATQGQRFCQIGRIKDGVGICRAFGLRGIISWILNKVLNWQIEAEAGKIAIMEGFIRISRRVGTGFRAIVAQANRRPYQSFARCHIIVSAKYPIAALNGVHVEFKKGFLVEFIGRVAAKGVHVFRRRHQGLAAIVYYIQQGCFCIRQSCV